MENTMTWKESLIFLQAKGCSYQFVYEYFKYGVAHHLSEGQMSEKHMRMVIVELEKQLKGRRIKLPKILELTSHFDDYCQHSKQLAKRSFMIGDTIYPINWLEIPQPPIIMYYDGAIEMLNKPLVSIVGTRSMSPYGREVVTELVKQFVAKDWISVSGLAKGVDTAVHVTASQLKRRSNIGILANGFEYTYPNENRNLQAEMAMNQLLLSEYLPNMKARPHHFVMRNRLISGLSKATLVIEAAKQSGSLITANYALQSNREVFVLPGRITDPQAYGCNSLINHGAIPIVSIEECVEEIARLFYNIGDN